MKFTLSWLNDFLESDASLEEITQMLTMIGLEVEKVENRAETLKPFRIAQIIDASPHPDADKLRVCRVNTGAEELQIVCGAPNARAGINVVLAPIGTVIPTNQMKIKPAKIRGVESAGMLCSAAELGLGEDHSGIIEMPGCDDHLAKPFAEIMGLDDPMIEIAITPNRGDCLGVYGIARDLAAAGIGTLKHPTFPDIAGSGDAAIQVTLEAPDICPYFIGRRFTGVKNGPAPAWLRQRLEAIGLRSISALVDITNYIAYSFGRPLHVYDADRLQGDIIIRHAKEGETIDALDEKTYTLRPDMAVIADHSGPQAIAGIIGSQASGCTEETSNVVLEVAFFSPDEVAKTGRSLGIHTDSRYRFERYVDPEFMERAAHLTTALILECCGGEASKLLTVGASPAKSRVLSFESSKVEAMTGVAVSQAECQNILTALGFTLKETHITIPSWRPDIHGDADIVEEVIRIYGYDAIPTTPLPSQAFTRCELDATRRHANHVSELLVSRGMDEVVSWSFMNREKAALFSSETTPVIANPINAELSVMRPTIIANLLDAWQRNASRGVKDVAFFEIGPVFHGTAPDQQPLQLALIRTGNAYPVTAHGEAREVDVFDVKADVMAALASAGAPVESLQLHTRQLPEYYHPGQAGNIALGKEILACFGMLHPKLLRQLDISVPVAVAEIYFSAIPVKRKKTTAKPRLLLSEFQHSIRDFAFIVARDLAVGELLRAVKNSDKQLIKEVSLFDVYQGEHVEADKKSVALSVTIQADDRTLTDEALDTLSKKIIQQAEKHCQAVLRG